MSAPHGDDAVAGVRFDESGLVPAIVQDARTGCVLTLAWMNAESLRRTRDTGETWFWSRSRGELWHKGETSGNTQTVTAVATDCDDDAILVSVHPAGPACHTGEETCFHVPMSGDAPTAARPFAVLPDLEAIIRQRAADADPTSSYTASLIARGIDTMCKKVGEEATEVAIAAKGGERDQLIYESADLLYHLVVLWQHLDVRLEDVAEELASRMRDTA
ncbi:MAG: bifunctional phosphoribosyl-AMP cyclohydrolase/phosphoribosyl-ATP diphosphatase HisIE [Thermoleophilia bacterium]|nr:bifunctional phosphoribosyl-AMP cyclohydrolase/phosphoribosyl-ATP diphosphatase HisIE [Thermoleophilia bacterium]